MPFASLRMLVTSRSAGAQVQWTVCPVQFSVSKLLEVNWNRSYTRYVIGFCCSFYTASILPGVVTRIPQAVTMS